MEPRSLWTDFKEFLLKQNALALAIGVIIGAAIGKVVAAIADDVINPVVGLLLPAGDWRNAKIVLSRATDAAGKVTHDLLHTEFPQPLEEILATVYRDDRPSGDLIHTRRDGS